jgi:hypothetical protein
LFKITDHRIENEVASSTDVEIFPPNNVKTGSAYPANLLFNIYLGCSSETTASVVRVSGCKPRGSGFGYGHCKIFCIAVDLKRGPLSLVRIMRSYLKEK